MLLRLVERSPEVPVNVPLCWASMAQKPLQLWHGYSSYEMVFDSKTNLPNIMTDGPPAVDGTTTSEILVKHLNAVHAARKAFIELEANERIR